MKKLLIVPLLFMTAEPASASVACQGTVSVVSLTPEGDVYADIGLASGGFKLCVQGANTAVNRGSTGSATINASQCQALYSGFWSAMASGKPVRIIVDGSACSLTIVNGIPNPYPTNIYFLSQ